MTELIEIITSLGDLEVGSHYKHSDCYANVSLEITDEVIRCVSETDSAILKPYIGMKMVVNGTWSSDYGFEGYDVDAYVLTERYIAEVVIPEVVIPAHTETTWELVKLINPTVEEIKP